MRSGEPCSAPADRRKSCVDSMPSCPSNLMVLPRLSPETIPSPHVSDRGSLPEQISTRPTVVSPPTYGDDSVSRYFHPVQPSAYAPASPKKRTKAHTPLRIWPTRRTEPIGSCQALP